eukprot:TRINITY_DN21632_c0_g1_i1.p1 TRINITY_DN21632_c0_g1~~TRINITY_DN21632_c0_g1_i1.p1  ORF type:complete len:504 (+),score=124.84 TRINITY_DN21632_c0_g1_i1:115-1512(+)
MPELRPAELSSDIVGSLDFYSPRGHTPNWRGGPPRLGNSVPPPTLASGALAVLRHSVSPAQRTGGRRARRGKGFDSSSDEEEEYGALPEGAVEPEVWRCVTLRGPARTAPSKCFGTGFGADNGPRDSMEDYFCVQNIDEGVVVGVFDGHRGRAAAEFAAKHLPALVDCQVRRHCGRLAQAVSEALVLCDLELLKRRPQGDPGSTATVALAASSGELCVGWLGDSRAVLCENGEAVPLTRDHRICDDWPEERKRVIAAVGQLGLQGVNDDVQVTRALGDFDHKQGLPHGDHSRCAISNHPELSLTRVTEGTQFLLVASDGLWDRMSEQEVVDWIQSYFVATPYLAVRDLHTLLETPPHGHPSPGSYLSTMMKRLCTVAVNELHSSDNVTAVILIFQPLEELVADARVHAQPDFASPPRALCPTTPPQRATVSPLQEVPWSPLPRQVTSPAPARGAQLRRSDASAPM